MRLQKYLAEAGVASRRKAEEMIAAGRVRVDGEIVTAMGTDVAGTEDIRVDDRPVLHAEEKVYILLNKPRGVITSVSDPQGRQTVLALLPELSARVYPVGRLDYNTEGALLLTNDGEVAFRMTHPRYEIHKTYSARVWGIVSQETLTRLRTGVMLEDGITAPADAEIIASGKDETTLRITLHEGRNRQVRRMIEAVGHTVRALRRTQIGSLTLGDLPVGAYRRLTDEEVRSVRALCALPPDTPYESLVK